MKVLVVAKKTNLEIYGETLQRHVREGLVDESSFREAQRAHEEHYASLKRLYEILTRLDVQYARVARGLFWPKLNKVQAVITMGGDGTVLEASHHIGNEPIPLLGVISSSASVGRLCYCKSDGLEEAVLALKANTLPTTNVHRLLAKISHTNRGETLTYPILNDFLFANANPAATTRYRISFGSVSEHHKSSGVWISTACGSSAVCAAAGGKVVDMSEEKFQFVVREPYQFKQPLQLIKSFFDPDDTSAQLVLENHSGRAMLALDGQHGSIDLQFGDRVTFLKAPPLRLAQELLST